MYIYVDSGDSTLIYTENIWSDFTVKLPNPIHLKEGSRWEIAVLQSLITASRTSVNTKDSTKPLYLLCDEVEWSVAGAKENKVLAVLQLRDNLRKLKNHTNPHYVGLVGDRITHLRLYLRDGEGKIFSLKDGTTWCALHIRRAPRS